MLSSLEFRPLHPNPCQTHRPLSTTLPPGRRSSRVDATSAGALLGCDEPHRQNPSGSSHIVLFINCGTIDPMPCPIQCPLSLYHAQGPPPHPRGQQWRRGVVRRGPYLWGHRHKQEVRRRRKGGTKGARWGAWGLLETSTFGPLPERVPISKDVHVNSDTGLLGGAPCWWSRS